MSEMDQIIFLFGEVLSEIDDSSDNADYYYLNDDLDDSLVEPIEYELDETFDVYSFDYSENTTRSIPEMVYM